MVKTIEHYISQLLYTHDCVIVMSFGGFVGSNIASKLNRKTGLLSPPNRSILFNTQLVENDGLLINHIAQSEGISQEKAKEELLKFVEISKANLTKYKSLRIKTIGLFTLNSDNKIIFNQDISINYNLNSFGFQDSVHNRIERESEIIEESLKIIRKKNDFSTKRLMKAAAILIPLIGISLISITQQQEINNIYKQIANLNPFTVNNTKHIKIDTETKVVEAKPELKTDIKKVVPEREEIVVLKQTHYIIAGAFGVEANAIKLKNKLNRWNYNSTIISNKKIMRVSYDSFSTKEQALSSLIKIRKENPAAWILSI